MNTEQEIASSVAESHDDLTKATEELLTLGFVVFYKWDRAFAKQQSQPSTPLTEAEISAIASSFTPREIADMKKVSRDALDAFCKSRNSHRFWSGVFQSLTASFFYSLLILLAAIFVKLIGSDFVTVLRPLFT